jgi:copper oxidase (laccase) domain-containing protein
MNVENIIKALEHQRNAALTQNVELIARNLELEAKVAWFEQNYSQEVSEVPDEPKKS